MAQRPEYTTIPFPPERQAIVDAGRNAHRRHVTHALLEMDVTAARRTMREHKARTGESLSFTAFLIACLARAIDENKHVHAYRNWRNQLVLFEQVDVATLIETEVDHLCPCTRLASRSAGWLKNPAWWRGGSKSANTCA